MEIATISEKTTSFQPIFPPEYVVKKYPPIKNNRTAVIKVIILFDTDVKSNKNSEAIKTPIQTAMKIASDK